MEQHQFFLRAIGEPHADWQVEALQDYLLRLKPFAKVDVRILREGHQGSSTPNIETARKTEADALLASLPKGGTIIALDETGKNFTSLQFAQKLRTWTDGGAPVTFLLGGSWGLDPTVRSQAHATIALGAHTLPHILARIVLLEQLYRAETILRGKTYHK